MRYFLVLGIFVLLLTLVISSSIVSGENEADGNAKAIQQNLTNETQNMTINANNATNVTIIEFMPLNPSKANKKVDASPNRNKSRKACPCQSRG